MYFVCIYFSGEKFLNKETFSRGHLSAKQALQNHIRKFHEHRYQCNICGKDFAGKIPLKYHKKAIHEGIKECICKYCQKAFARPSCLHGHIKQVHLKDSKDRKYCEFCAVSFLRAYDLKNHVATVHRGERPHKCEYCGKNFGSRVNLKNHTRSVHEGRRDYICDTCGQAFHSSTAMKRHDLSVHKGVRYRCDICNYTTTQMEPLKKHIANNHGQTALEDFNFALRMKKEQERLEVVNKQNLIEMKSEIIANNISAADQNNSQKDNVDVENI